MFAFIAFGSFLLTFFGEPKDHHAYDHAHESPWIMLGPLVLLATLATVAGFFALDQVGSSLGFVGGIGQLVFLEHPHAFTHPEWLLASIATLSALHSQMICTREPAKSIAFSTRFPRP